MNLLFHTEPVDLEWWVWPSLLGVVIYLLAELKKVLTGRAVRRGSEPAA